MNKRAGEEDDAISLDRDVWRWMCDWIRRHLPLILILLACYAAYSNAIGAQFSHDDKSLVLNASWERFGRSLVSATDAVFYRPLAELSFVVDKELWGEESRGYHATNLLLHALNCLLIFLILSRWVSQGLATAIAVIFAVHPVHTEAVTWIAGRMNLLCTLFLLLSTWSLIAWLKRNDRRFLFYSEVLFAFGLMTYEQAIVWPLLAAAVVLVDARLNSVLNSVSGGRWRALIPLFFLSTTYVAWRFTLFGGIGGYQSGGSSILAQFDTRSFLLFYKYVYLLLGGSWAGIEHFQSFLAGQLPSNEVFLGAAGLGLVIAGFLWIGLHCWRRRSSGRMARETLWIFAFGLFWWMVSALPAWTTGSRRTLYLPSLGFIIMALAGVQSLWVGRRGFLTALTGVALLLGSVTWIRNLDWRAAGRMERELVSQFQDMYPSDPPEVIYVEVPVHIGDALFFASSSMESDFSRIYPGRRVNVYTNKRSAPSEKRHLSSFLWDVESERLERVRR